MNDDPDRETVAAVAVLGFAMMVAAGAGMLASTWLSDMSAAGVGLIVFPFAFIALAKVT